MLQTIDRILASKYVNRCIFTLTLLIALTVSGYMAWHGLPIAALIAYFVLVWSFSVLHFLLIAGWDLFYERYMRRKPLLK